MTDVEYLDSLPTMGRAFASALMPRRRSATLTLPSRPAGVRGVRHDASRFADYATVCGFTRTDVLPPTWLHVLTFPLHIHLLGHKDSSIKLVGSVHVSNSMTLLRPVTPDEVLDVTVAVENLRPHRRGALVDLVGSVTSAGEPVWNGVSTYLAQGATMPGEPVETPREEFTPRSPEMLWELPAGLGKDYRRVSGDPNPIHTSRVAARLFGFSKPIIHGMWTHARVLSRLEETLPDAYRVQATFTKPIGLPTTVGFSAERDRDVVRAAVTTPRGDKPHLLVNIAP